MTLKIYIDTNIFLDFILKRDDGISREILYYLHSKGFIVALNDISIINIHYFAKKALTKKEVKDFIDFEDVVQYFCAKSIDANLIITNDKKGFRNSQIDVVTSQNFYKKYIKFQPQ